MTMTIAQPAPPARKAPEHDPRPWWRFPLMWMVVGGPAIVVVAAIGTAVVAIRGQDPVLSEVEKEAQGQGHGQPVKVDAMTPAMTARNHASTAQH